MHAIHLQHWCGGGTIACTKQANFDKAQRFKGGQAGGSQAAGSIKQWCRRDAQADASTVVISGFHSNTAMDRG
ncbi:hypothetical protein C1H46_012297 [Malus baccata]|uniref:Uncharacterized protein n=1 Tax=Malus baccata TaxID=106549 RepID=A0A540MTM6_MALBA|nr:hypothetical protein C1H46_012297 [Malus baccata]